MKGEVLGEQKDLSGLPFRDPLPSSLGYKMQNLRVTLELLSWYQIHLTLFPILSLFTSSPFSKWLASQ